MTQVLSLFKVFQPRVDHFFHPMQLRAPCVLGIVESLIDSVESGIYVSPQITETGVEIAQPRVVDEDPHEDGDCRDTNRKGDLNGLVGHRSLHDTPYSADVAHASRRAVSRFVSTTL
jgi:hypothetical protein